MTAQSPQRPRRPGHRPSSLSAAGRPRKVADSRRVRSTATSVDEGPRADGSVETGSAGQADPAVEPARMPSEAGLDARSAADAGSLRSRRPPLGRLAVVLLAVAVVLTVVVGVLTWDLMRKDARADARQAAQVVAAESMETILSYDHASYDKGVRTAKSLMTAGFAKEYARTVDDVRPAVMDTESQVKAQVVASSVVSAEPDRVKTLLFVNQTTTGKQVEDPRVDLNRVVVTLVREDGAWLVSDITAL